MKNINILTNFNWVINSSHIFIGVAMLLTFIGFMSLDPEPSLILSISSAANVGIMMGGIYQLYKWDLLLSPINSVLIGPGLIFYYSWGNIGARIAGDERYVGNPGSLVQYPTAALLTTIGLGLFCLVTFKYFYREVRYTKIRYQDLVWKPYQSLNASVFALGVVVYLSIKYEFIDGYYRGVEGNLDKWLSASYYSFLMMAIVIGVSVTVKATRVRDYIMGVLGFILPIILSLGSRSRTFMLMVATTIVLCWITINKKKVFFILLLLLPVAFVIFALGTVVKIVGMSSASTVVENLIAVASVDVKMIKDLNITSGKTDIGYRIAGFEHPASIIVSLNNGVSPMYGEGFMAGLLSGLPSFIRPEGEISERIAIYEHFRGRGLDYGDSIGVPLTSGLADWGVMAGPLIYIVIAIYCLVVWHIVQSSPRLFFAYLMAGAAVGDLFWENGFYAIRSICFAWMILFVTGPVFMPRCIKGEISV